MATPITLPVTTRHLADGISDEVSDDVVKTAASAGTAVDQQNALSDEDLMPFYFLSMAGGY